MGQFFLVELTEVNESIVRVTFPARDYPVDGMAVSLDFHDADGFNSYTTVVVQGPIQSAGELVLKRPDQFHRTQHRQTARVPTDLAAQVKDQIHVRRYNAALLNVSGGGALIECEAPFEIGSTVEITLSLPGEPLLQILGKVAHATDSARPGKTGIRAFGVNFVGLSPGVCANSIPDRERHEDNNWDCRRQSSPRPCN
jgi:Tfp pilus assembly protein PilZ